MHTIYTEKIKYGGNNRIRLTFVYDPDLMKSLYKLPDIRWSPTINSWHFRYVDDHIKYLNDMFKGKYCFVEKVSKTQNKEPGNKFVYFQHVPSENLIFLRFRYNKTILDLIKTIDKPLWHSDLKLWSIEGGSNRYNTLIEILIRNNCKPVTSRIYLPEKTPVPNTRKTLSENKLPQKFLNYMALKNYSTKTIRAYTHHLSKFLSKWDRVYSPLLSPEQVSNYIWKTVTEKDYSRSYQNQMINAIKLYYRVMEGKILETDSVPRPKRNRKFPVVLSREEITALVQTLRNHKHQMVIMLIYGTGIRLSESVNLTINDVDFQRGLIHVRGGKGNKDRIVPLPKILSKKLKEYIQIHSPRKHLFEGQNGGIYSTRSVQNILKKALMDAGIDKNASIHSLRHSYATHTLENGTDIRLLKEVLGHASIKTTEIYTHISNASILSIKSPIDNLEF